MARSDVSFNYQRVQPTIGHPEHGRRILHLSDSLAITPRFLEPYEPPNCSLTRGRITLPSAFLGSASVK